ncbi:MAG TPA: GNAT family N-acetyltransferase [Solirubrobacterales bacterium]|nr:GNAT family N-acetyltransferase [Solirubrobacterales bacterium]
MPLRTEWIADLRRFGELAAGWDALLPKDSHPFDSHGWYEAWWKAFGGEGELAVCTVWRDGELAGGIPLSANGRRLKGLVNGHSGTFRPLARDGEAMEALIAAALARRPPELELPMLPAADGSLPLLESGAREAAMLPLAEPSYVSPIVDTSGDFEAWRKGSHSSWKGRLARYRRKMQRDHDAELEIVAVPGDLEAWLEEGLRLEASGWKGEAGTAILSAPETASFYRDIARRFHERGELRLSRIALDGEVVAFSFCILWGSRLYSLKVGYDETRRKLVPGLVMQLSIVERCFELGFEAYELLGETSDWKEKVSGDERRYVTLRAYPRRPVGLLRHSYRARLRPVLKSTYRRLRPRGR